MMALAISDPGVFVQQSLDAMTTLRTFLIKLEINLNDPYEEALRKMFANSSVQAFSKDLLGTPQMPHLERETMERTKLLFKRTKNLMVDQSILLKAWLVFHWLHFAKEKRQLSALADWQKGLLSLNERILHLKSGNKLMHHYLVAIARADSTTGSNIIKKAGAIIAKLENVVRAAKGLILHRSRFSGFENNFRSIGEKIRQDHDYRRNVETALRSRSKNWLEAFESYVQEAGDRRSNTYERENRMMTQMHLIHRQNADFKLLIMNWLSLFAKCYDKMLEVRQIFAKFGKEFQELSTRGQQIAFYLSSMCHNNLDSKAVIKLDNSLKPLVCRNKEVQERFFRIIGTEKRYFHHASIALYIRQLTLTNQVSKIRDVLKLIARRLNQIFYVEKRRVAQPLINGAKFRKKLRLDRLEILAFSYSRIKNGLVKLKAFFKRIPLLTCFFLKKVPLSLSNFIFLLEVYIRFTSYLSSTREILFRLSETKVQINKQEIVLKRCREFWRNHNINDMKVLDRHRRLLERQKNESHLLMDWLKQTCVTRDKFNRLIGRIHVLREASQPLQVRCFKPYCLMTFRHLNTECYHSMDQHKHDSKTNTGELGLEYVNNDLMRILYQCKHSMAILRIKYYAFRISTVPNILEKFLWSKQALGGDNRLFSLIDSVDVARISRLLWILTQISGNFKPIIKILHDLELIMQKLRHKTSATNLNLQHLTVRVKALLTDLMLTTSSILKYRSRRKEITSSLNSIVCLLKVYSSINSAGLMNYVKKHSSSMSNHLVRLSSVLSTLKHWEKNQQKAIFETYNEARDLKINLQLSRNHARNLDVFMQSRIVQLEEMVLALRNLKTRERTLREHFRTFAFACSKAYCDSYYHSQLTWYYFIRMNGFVSHQKFLLQCIRKARWIFSSYRSKTLTENVGCDKDTKAFDDSLMVSLLLKMRIAIPLASKKVKDLRSTWQQTAPTIFNTIRLRPKDNVPILMCPQLGALSSTTKRTLLQGRRVYRVLQKSLLLRRTGLVAENRKTYNGCPDCKLLRANLIDTEAELIQAYQILQLKLQQDDLASCSKETIRSKLGSFIKDEINCLQRVQKSPELYETMLTSMSSLSSPSQASSDNPLFGIPKTRDMETKSAARLRPYSRSSCYLIN